MAETAARNGPLDYFAAITVRNRLGISAGPDAVRLVLRGSPAVAQDAGTAFGLALPDRLNHATANGDRAAFKIGPDEWLLIGPAGDGEAARRTLDEAIDEPHALVDVSDRNVSVIVEGSLAADVLSTGVMLDLDPAAFPVGTATRTLYAKAEIVLWRKAASTFHVEVWRSFAPYLFGHLKEAAREYVKG